MRQTMKDNKETDEKHYIRSQFIGYPLIDVLEKDPKLWVEIMDQVMDAPHLKDLKEKIKETV